MQAARIIQWTTGKVGQMALRGILDDPRLELVGVFAHAAAKVGVDAGTLCDRPAVGVAATDDIDALLALGADAVIYAPFEADANHVVRLLESGVDVVSTNLMSNLGGITGALRERLAAACAKGGSSLHITGINPGWFDTLAAAALPICRRLGSVTITECVDVTSYESAETWRSLGFGETRLTEAMRERARDNLLSFRDSLRRLADALRFTLDDIEFFMEFGTARDDLDLGWFTMPRGTHAAIRSGWRGKAGGRTVVENRVVWYMTRDLVEDWEIDADNYRVVAEGEPGVDLRVRVRVPADWSPIEHTICTALPAVNAVFEVIAAPPGILGLQDIALSTVPAGLLPAYPG